MTQQPSKSTKLRFALITEDALDKLRPRSQSTNLPPTSDSADLYSIVHSTVKQVVESKLMDLNLDLVIEQKIHIALTERDRAMRSAGLYAPRGTPIDIHSDVFPLAQPFEPPKSRTKLEDEQLLTTKVKRQRGSKARKSTAVEQQSTRPPVCHRPSTMESRPAKTTKTRQRKALAADRVARAAAAAEEEPSVLKFAAMYLQDLQEQRRKQKLTLAST